MDGYFDELSLHARVAQQDAQLLNFGATLRGYQQEASRQRTELERLQADNARLQRENTILRSQKAYQQALVDSEQWSTGGVTTHMNVLDDDDDESCEIDPADVTREWTAAGVHTRVHFSSEDHRRHNRHVSTGVRRPRCDSGTTDLDDLTGVVSDIGSNVTRHMSHVAHRVSPAPLSISAHSGNNAHDMSHVTRNTPPLPASVSAHSENNTQDLSTVTPRSSVRNTIACSDDKLTSRRRTKKRRRLAATTSSIGQRAVGSSSLANSVSRNISELAVGAGTSSVSAPNQVGVGLGVVRRDRAAGCVFSDNNMCGKHGGGKTCSTDGCIKVAISNGRCVRHGGGHRCQFAQGCSNGAVGASVFCVKHGGGKRCQYPQGCNKVAASGIDTAPMCRAHGGGARCLHPGGCEKAAKAPGSLCVGHGGGRRCQHPQGCKYAAAGRTLFCATHGGGKRCRTPECSRAASNGKLGFCKAHGGGKRCAFHGDGENEDSRCTKSAQWPLQFCVMHGGGRRCTVEGGCTRSAVGTTLLCVSHGK